MYKLPYYKDKDEKAVKTFIDDYPFAYISGCSSDNKPVATQIPVFIEEKDGKTFLMGHIMKNTDHHKAFMQNDNVLVVFTGHHTYVSATWYSDPNIASTWNYMSVHARGKISFPDGKALEEVLRKTSLHFEKYNEHSPTVFDNLHADFKTKMMKAIVAFRIEVEEIEHVFKLSQDRDEISYLNIIRELKDQGENGIVIAREMEKRYRDVFRKG